MVLNFFPLVAIVVGVFGVTAAHAAASGSDTGPPAVSKTYIAKGFDMIDTDHNGVLDRNEWNAFLTQYLEMQLKALDTSFDAADTNHDGKLSHEEMQAVNPLLAKYFDKIDTHHRGYVTKEDMRAAMHQQMGRALEQ
ncbi:EF-hand domain-containing protein [Burkholderia arboris]|uniref:EF-hand domain-containing protein n=1 Tax=Burkholderia arboris TaxID=488730 RepID=UPI001CA3DF68|nr:EF-hand domain-containing protein [Burkholderia arboris]MBY8610510.1 EF-hand domain-containing protein [Burkholderia arboris]